MSEILAHHHDRCTGVWRGMYEDGNDLIYCTECRIRYANCSLELRYAAIDENWAGIYLKRLTDEGAALLKEES